MIRNIPIRAASTALALLLLCGCQNVPKYKKSSGKFNEWKGYEGENFSPESGSVVSVDASANTVTVAAHGKTLVLTVLPSTRVMHEGTDVPISQLPVGKEIKFTYSEDGKELRTIWYGEHSNGIRHNVQAKSKNSLY
jgi:hypothetical protein